MKDWDMMRASTICPGGGKNPFPNPAYQCRRGGSTEATQVPLPAAGTNHWLPVDHGTRTSGMELEHCSVDPSPLRHWWPPFNSEAEMNEMEGLTEIQRDRWSVDHDGNIIIPLDLDDPSDYLLLTLPDLIAMLEALSPQERPGGER